MNNKEYCIGLDVSTKSIGVTVMDLNGKLVKITHITPPSSTKESLTMMEKADFAKNFLKNLNLVNIKHIFIEEPLFGSNNAFTALTLVKFNGIISRIVYEMYGVEPTYITVHNARKFFLPELVVEEKGKQILRFPKDCDKKQLIFDKVSWLEPQITWEYSGKLHKLKKENYDMADSYVVATSGLIAAGYNGAEY